MNRQAFNDLTLDDDDSAPVEMEEAKRAESDEEDAEFKYDRALYDADGLDEDVDFDDDDWVSLHLQMKA